MEYHAGEAHAASPAIVEGLLVLEQAALRRSDRMQHGIGRGNTADAIAVADVGRRLEPAPGSHAAARSSMASSTSRPVSCSAGSTGRRVAELRADVA